MNLWCKWGEEEEPPETSLEEEVERMKWGKWVCRWLSKISSWSQVTNGAPPTNASLVTLVTNGAPAGGAPLVVLQNNMIVVAHWVSGTPLLVKTSNGAQCPGAPLVFLEKNMLVVAHQHMMRHCYIGVVHHMSGVPLVSILSIALFLAVSRYS